MKKIEIIGHFGKGKSFFDGQTVKTKNLAQGLKNDKKNEVIEIDTYNWKTHPIKLIFNLISGAKNSDALIMLPAHNGLKVFTPMLILIKKLLGKPIYYDVIGGWLPEYLEDKKGLTKRLKGFDGIWVETNTMKKKLDSMGFSNVSVVPNFKNIAPIKKEELIYEKELPLKLCTFSRIMKEKGIEQAIEAVNEVNNRLGYTAYCLDIYGKVDKNYEERFGQLKQDFPEYIRYKGCVPPEESVQVLKGYFALLFPTEYYTEGIPGTIIDAYSAGVPVIASRWKSFRDVVDDGVTGIGYDFGNAEELKEILLKVAENPETLLDKKENCLEKAREYESGAVIEKIYELLKRG